MPTSLAGAAAITENLLKRKWSTAIMRLLEQGINDQAEIVKAQPAISPKALSERLRSMRRFGVVARYPRPGPAGNVEYRLTPLGKKLLELLDMIDQLDRRFNSAHSRLIESPPDAIVGAAAPLTNHELEK